MYKTTEFSGFLMAICRSCSITLVVVLFYLLPLIIIIELFTNLMPEDAKKKGKESSK